MRISIATLALAAAMAPLLITTASSTEAERDLSPELSQALSPAGRTWFKDNY